MTTPGGRAAPHRAHLRRTLPASARRALRTLTSSAASASARIYLVGGPVRDLLLGRPVADVDVLLSARLAEVARAAARALDAELELRPGFLTATLNSGGLRVDLSQARRERYPHPGALPVVEPGSLDEDLFRRDFAAHALALPLDARSGSRLLDPWDGLADLDARRLRTLHAASFRDDPTRLLRAARYCARLRFRLAPATGAELAGALEARALDTVSGVRIRHELERLLDEAEPGRAAAWTSRLGLFDAISAGWRVGASTQRALAKLARRAPWPEADDTAVRRGAGLRALLAETPARARNRALDRLGFEGRPLQELRADLDEQPRLLRALGRDPAPGALDARLRGRSEAALLAAHCAAPAAAARQVRRYARELRHVPDPIDGHAARALGVEGPEVGALLRAARARELDGKPTGAAWRRRWLARRSGMR